MCVCVRQEVDTMAYVLPETQIFHPYKPICPIIYHFRFPLPCKGKETHLYLIYDF